MTVRILLALAALAGALFVLGSLARSLLKQKASVFHAFTWGFVVALAVFHVLAYPMHLAGASFSALFYCYTGCLAALLLYGLYRLAWRKEILNYTACPVSLLRDAGKTPLLYAAAAVSVCLYLILALGFFHSSSDDAYYMPRAMEVIAQDSLTLPSSLGWFGREVPNWPESSDASTLEFFKAYLSVCTGLPVLVVCRTVLAILLSLISLMTIWNLAGDVAAEQENTLRIQTIAMLFYCLFASMRSFSRDSEAMWALERIWQGKSILCGIVFPMIFSGCIKIIRCQDQPIPWGYWVEMAFLMTAGIAATIVGVFLPFLCYLMLGLPYLLTCGWKRGKRMLLPIIASLIPVIICSGLTLLHVLTETAEVYSVGSKSGGGLVWSEVFWAMFGQDHYRGLTIYLLGVAYIGLRGSREERLLFVAPLILQFLTLLNPLLIDFVSKNITTTSVYFRLYWLLPVCFLPAYALGKGLCRLPVSRLKDCIRGGAAVLVFLVALSVFQFGPMGAVKHYAQEVSQKALAPIRMNYYGIDTQLVRTAEAILKDHSESDRPVVMTDYSGLMEEYLRQYSAEIVLANPVRPGNLNKMRESVPGTDLNQGEFYRQFLDGELADEMICASLKVIGIDYLAFAAESELLTQDTPWAVPVGTFGEYKLWKVN